jgi:hypothetical protein
MLTRQRAQGHRHPVKNLAPDDEPRTRRRQRQQNPWLIPMLAWQERMGEVESSTGLPKRMRAEIERLS